MAENWEWGPWASQGEDLAKQQRELEKQRDQAGLQLRNLLEGKKFDEQAKIATEERQANQSIPALRALMKGNPEVGQAFGFGPKEGAIPQGQFGPGPKVVTEPSDEELRGYAKAVPGMASAILQKRLEATKGPIALPSKSRLVSPSGEVLVPADQEPAGGLSFPSPEAAEAYWQQWKNTDPRGTAKYRPNIQADPTHGGYKLNLQTGEALTEGPNYWLSKSMDMTAPVPERIEAKMKYDKWLEDQTTLAGKKTEAQQAAMPLPTEVRDNLRKIDATIDAVDTIQMNYTSQDRRLFTGLLKDRVARGALALYEATGWTPAVSGYGYTEDQLKKLADFRKLNGQIEQYKFAVGGKQLTEGEQRVVDAFIPTGREVTSAEYEAKLVGLKKIMRAQAAAELVLAQTPRQYITIDTVRDAMRNALAKEGIDLKVKAKDQVQHNMSPRERLLNKYPGSE